MRTGTAKVCIGILIVVGFNAPTVADGPAAQAAPHGCTFTLDPHNPVKDGGRITGKAIVRLSGDCDEPLPATGVLERKDCPISGCYYKWVDTRDKWIDPGSTYIFRLDAECKDGTHRYRVRAKLDWQSQYSDGLEFTC